MKKTIALLLALALCLACAGCGTASTTAASTTDSADASASSAATAETTTAETSEGHDTITLCNTSAIPDYNPVNWYITSQSTMFCNVYSTLVDVIITDDLQVELRGNIAQSWETENDGATWVFHLNENAVFTDGKPVTADICKRCMEYHFTNPYTMSYVSMVDNIEVRDEHTLVVNLTQPWASVPYCWYMIAVFDVDAYEADPDTYIKNPNGSGPYELIAMDEAQGTMTMTLKDNWWGDVQPTVKTINVVTITDTSTQIIALQNGEINQLNVSGTNVALLSTDPNIELKESVSIIPTQVLLNTNVSPYDNDLVREAISYAIDYDAVRAVITSGYTSSKDTTLVFATLDRDLPEDIPTYSYDPEKAAELLQESGLELPIDGGDIVGGTSNGTAEMIQQYLAAVGINVNVVALETNTMVQKLMGHEFGIGITSGVGNPTAAETILCYYGSGQPYNFNAFSNERVDELAQTLMTTSDTEEYDAALHEALEIVSAAHTNLNLGIAAQYTAYTAGYYIPPTWNGVDMFRVK